MLFSLANAALQYTYIAAREDSQCQLKKFRKMPSYPWNPEYSRKKGGGFHSPSQFARQNLFCVLWGDEYVCDVPYKVRRNYLDTLVLFRIVDGGMFFEYREKSFTATSGDVVFLDARFPHYYRALGPLRLQTYMITGNCSQAYFDMLYRQHGVHFLNRAKTSFYLIIFRMRFPAIFRTITSFLFSFTIS